jgi:hypothetical protein
MDCERARDLLGATAGDAQLSEHLEGCADCAAIAAVVGLAAGLPEEDPPAGFEARLRARLDVAASAARPRPSRRWAAAGAGALALAGLAFAALLLPRSGAVRPGAAPSAAVTRRPATFAALPPTAALPRSPAAGGGSAKQAVASRPAAAAREAAVPPPSPSPDVLVQRMVVENASVAVQVADVRQAFDRLQLWVTTVGGFVGSSGLSSGDRGEQASLELRVPSDQIGALLEQLRGMGRVTQVSQSGRDVTAQYVDLGARLRALQAEEDAYLRLLSRAKTIGDTLQLEQQLTQVRAQIESLAAQRNELRRLAALATVRVQISPAPRAVGSLQASWQTFLAALRDIGLAAVWILPWALLAAAAGAIVLLLRRLARR